jgi:hypothetical protein
MAGAMRKLVAPVPISQSRDHEQERRPTNFLLKHFERRSVVAIAVMCALLVSVVGMLLGYSVTLFHLPWLNERVVENIIEGVWFGLLMWAFLKAREKRLRQRANEVGYLNHHIRNSLQMADGYVTEAGQRSELITHASTRIRLCVEKISREGDCEINDNSPEQP